MTGRRNMLWIFVALALAGPADSALTARGREAAAAQQPAAPARTPDVIFVPTPDSVIAAMLKTAKVTKNDIVYDLGCGDGRIVVAAARDFGARAIGIDIDPQRISEANENAKKGGVVGRATFRQEDLFTANIAEANVVALYLLPSLNLKLRPKLWKELKVGTRIVSHAFDMGDWEPEVRQEVDGRQIFMWTITDAVKKRAATEGAE
jgi:ribosomal protein L11 methylase PrmA